MSAAAIISIRIKRIFNFLRDHRAISPESAIPEIKIPYSNKWYFQRLIRFGAIKQVGEKCYLDEDAAQEYRKSRRLRAFNYLALVLFLYFLYIVLINIL